MNEQKLRKVERPDEHRSEYEKDQSRFQHRRALVSFPPA